MDQDRASAWRTFPATYNAYGDFVEANLAAGRGDKTAFVDPDGALTYGQLAERAARFAGALKSLGIAREQRIALLMLDTTAFPVAFWGAIRGGIVPVPLNTLLTPEQYKYLLNDSRAVALVVSAALREKIEPIAQELAHLKTVIVADGEAAWGELGLDQLIAESPPATAVAETSPDETAFWLYSSGSTGNPKGVRHLHSSLIETARLYGQQVLGIREDDVVYSAAKLFFAYGLGNAMSFPMSVGATTVLYPGRPTPDAVLDILKRHQPSIFYGVPTLYAALLATPGLGPGAGSDKLRICVSAG